MFLALPLYNQRPIKAHFPKTKEQFPLEHEFGPHFEGCFSAFCYQGLQRHEVVCLRVHRVARGSGALQGGAASGATVPGLVLEEQGS